MKRARVLAFALCLASPALAEDPPMVDGPYAVTEVQGQPATYAAILSFAEGQLTGNGPCNRFFATLVQDGANLRISDLGSTRRTCPDLDAEAAFFALLAQVTRQERQDGQITLFDAQGQALFHLVSARL